MTAPLPACSACGCPPGARGTQCPAEIAVLPKPPPQTQCPCRCHEPAPAKRLNMVGTARPDGSQLCSLEEAYRCPGCGIAKLLVVHRPGRQLLCLDCDGRTAPQVTP